MCGLKSIYFAQFHLEAGNPRSKCQQTWRLVRTHFPTLDSCLLAGCLRGHERDVFFLSFLRRALTNPIYEGSILTTYYFSKAPSPNTITLRIKLQKFWRDLNIQAIALRKNKLLLKLLISKFYYLGHSVKQGKGGKHFWDQSIRGYVSSMSTVRSL